MGEYQFDSASSVTPWTPDTLCYRATLAGERDLLLTYFCKPDGLGASETLSITELHANGSRTCLLSRQRCAHGPIAAGMQPIHTEPRDHSGKGPLPASRGLLGQQRTRSDAAGPALTAAAAKLMNRLHWPPLAAPAHLLPEAIVVGRELNLFGMRIQILGASDADTAAWLRERGMEVGEQPTSFSVSLTSSVADATQTVRPRPPSSRALSEAERHERAIRIGHNRAVCFRAVGGAGAVRRFVLAFFLSDETLQVHELHPAQAGSDFCKRVPGGGGAMRELFLRRSRVPRDLRTLNSQNPSHQHHMVLGSDALPVGADGSYVGLDDLRCGGTVAVVGTPLRIVCCEPSSRALLEREIGVNVGEDEEKWGGE